MVMSPRTNPLDPIDSDLPARQNSMGPDERLRRLERAIKDDPSDEAALVSYLLEKRRQVREPLESLGEIDRQISLLTTKKRQALRAARSLYERFLDYVEGRRELLYEDEYYDYNFYLSIRNITNIINLMQDLSWAEMVMDDNISSSILEEMSARDYRLRINRLAHKTKLRYKARLHSQRSEIEREEVSDSNSRSHTIRHNYGPVNPHDSVDMNNKDMTPPCDSCRGTNKSCGCYVE